MMRNQLLYNIIENACRKNRLKAQVGEPSKGRSASACRSTDKGSAAAAAMARLELEDCESSNSGSLEDLVNSFDEKLTAVLQNYHEQVDKIAPVQVCTRQTLIFVWVYHRIVSESECGKFS